MYFPFFPSIKYRSGKILTSSKTNMLKDKDREYVSHFSETSFIKTLRKLIHSGEYNKTKKRMNPLYCFGSTIICTRYPEFFSKDKLQILPRPYQTSKPNNKGYKII